MHNGLNGPIRIGRIDYTNVWPVFYHFNPALLRCKPDIVQGMPAELNRKLREGDIDVAAVSSFAYGLHSDDYLLLPDLSVSAIGRVRSILLFLKKPLEEAIHGRIAFTKTSATSVNLLKMIISKFYGGHPVYEEAEPSLENMLANADAALLIGDHAIRASWQNHGCEVLDLSELWHRFTGHGMTFAVWAVRRTSAEANPEAIGEIYEALVCAKRRSAGNMQPIVAHAMNTVGGMSAYWHEYFGGLRHDFGPEQRAGLELYFRYAKELGLMGAAKIAEWSSAGVSTVLAESANIETRR